MNRLRIKHLLLDKGLTMLDLSRAAGIPYDRLVKLVGGYREARPHELSTIASMLGVSEGSLALRDPENHAPASRG